MDCKYLEICGGCFYKNLSENDYKNEKESKFKNILKNISQEHFSYGNTIFIPAGTRRRASFAFKIEKGALLFGFNEEGSHKITSIENCPVLTSKINNNIEHIKDLIAEICKSPIMLNLKKKQTKTVFITSGDISVCEAYNGLDLVIETKEDLSIDHRFIIGSTINGNGDIIRISHKKSRFEEPEIIIEKTKPFIKICGIDVYIAPGTFLQASDEAERALINLVQNYMGETSGKIADLFCGIGTFSYPLSKNKNNKIFSFDSSKELLNGFKMTINKNMITNINIKQTNLFKYPLDETELKEFEAIVFDPPRAGAAAQINKIFKMQNADKPKKIIAISCNPYSFINDANILIESGYKIEEITLVDQFTYSKHCELVALFTKTE